MTGLYVRSNVQSLVSQNQVNRNLGELSEIMTRLSTGLRINTGKDDPAGLIASELLKADMTATKKAISNVQRANDMVAIADSAMGQISSLLNDIKGLINEAANTGTMTYEQLLANQLQVDAALDSIDRIAKTTNYLGKNILDGSLDFNTVGLDRSAVRSLSVYQANFGTKDHVDVGISVIEDASRGQLFYDKAGVSVDTVFEIVGNDGSSLVKVAGGQGVDAIAEAVNLVSDSTGVRAIVGKDATAGQIFLTSAGLDNDINLTALMTGAAAGNYTVKFSASDSDQTTYTITDPQNGKPGIIDFKLKMQPYVAPSVTKLDESFDKGIYTYNITGDRTDPKIMGGIPIDLVVQTSGGQQIRQVEFVKFDATNASLPNSVAATYDKITGKLQIQYDAAGNITEAALATAINAIEGFEYKGIYQVNAAGDSVKLPSTNVAQISTTDYYITHTDKDIAAGTVIDFFDTGFADSAVAITYNGTNIAVSKGSLATYDDVIAALNATNTWDMSLAPPGTIRPAANSFTLVDESGIPKSGSATAPNGLGAAAVTLDEVIDPASSQIALTQIGTTGIHLRTTDTEWNGLSLEVTIISSDFSIGDMTFDAENAAKLDGLTIVIDDGALPPGFVQGDSTFAAGTLTIYTDGAAFGSTALATAAINAAIAARWDDSTGIAAYLRGTGNIDAIGTAPVLKGAVAADPPAPGTFLIHDPVPKVDVVFDETTGEITIDAKDNATYDDILAALKDIGGWTVINAPGTFPTPSSSTGLALVDADGKPATDANTLFSITGMDGVVIPLEDVIVSNATTALREWLMASGTGTKAAVDMRSNNALDISAAVAGTKFENTDVVYVKAEGQMFSESFRFGYQNVYLSSENTVLNGAMGLDPGPPPAMVPIPAGTTLQGVTINFRDAGASGVTNATFNADGTILNVDIKDGDGLDLVLLKIQQAANDFTFNFIDPTQAPIDMTRSASTLIGSTLHLGNVQLDYRDTPMKAAATITLDSGNIQMRIVADKVGTEFNDVVIEFEQDNSFNPGDVSVVYDEVRKILHVRGQIDGVNAATYGALKAAIESASPFHVDVTTTNDNKAYPLSNKLHSGLSTAGSGTSGLTENGPKGSATIKTGQYVGDVGGNNQTLYITVATGTTANDVVEAFNNAKGATAQIAANFIVSNSIDNDGTGIIFDDRFDSKIHVRVFSSALTGGNSGLKTDVTAKELVNLINNDAVLSKLFRADIARGQVGNGFLTLFDEAAYYGSTIDDNALQFLGPAGSPDILFVIDGPNSSLGLSFVDNYGSGCISDDRPVASLNATNANAAFSVQAMTGGSQYDDMVVRMIRLDNNHSAADSYAIYKDGPSNAMTYCSINNNQAVDGTSEEKGKFIIYANKQGDMYNNVDVVVQLDLDQTAPAAARYDEATQRLIITVNSGDTTLSQAVAAINMEGTFHAEYDFSFNNRNESSSDAPGLETFDKLLSAMGATEAVIGNTGNTGGHKGGVLEVYVGGTDEQITANAVISTINSSPTTASLFAATAIGRIDAGTGIINFRSDNIKHVIGVDGKVRNEVNMVSGILGSDENATSYMVVHLATDANGNSITTARDLVKFFDQLTPEQTRGISVSVVRPPGVDNLDRVWSYDSCGNLIETQLCEDNWGLGLLQPTYEVDDCYNYTYFPIEFFSYGQDIRPGNAYGSVIAQGGKDASLDIRSKVQGPDFNGVNFKYVKLENALDAMYAEYDAYNKTIVVHIHEGTTAGQVKAAIENSEGTKNLFEVSLPGNGSGIVSLQDDYLITKGGLVDVGYRGGAAMLGAADADAHRLILESMGEGSRQFVSLRWLDGGDFRVTDANGNTTDTSYGTDMIATINGMKASADGRTLTLESAMLKMGIILDGRVTTGDRVNFTINGGGAVIQMGTDVVSNQQIRFGIQSINTANLGGASGRLYQLRTGEIADLVTSDASRRLADRIINEAILSVAQTRGRLGAIQRNTLEPQIRALQDSLVATSAAEAQISNADFAEETSRLTRAQILVQAGTRTLSIANQFPQYAASLLGG